MGAFDPDAWLAKKQEPAPPSAFDPDAWLSKKAETETTTAPAACKSA
jgi:hypothetical protein